MRILLVFITILLSAVSSFPQEEMSLNKAIQIALHNNSNYLKSHNRLDAFESNVQAAYGNFLPTLSLNAGWDWTRSDVQGVGTTFVNGVPVLRVATTATTRNYRGSVNSNWTLFDGLANISALSQSKNDLESARYTLERIKQDIVFQTMSFYYDIVYTAQLLGVKEDNLKWNEKNLETIKERNRLGAATIADVYQQEVAKGNAELDLIRTDNDLATAKKNLLFFLGIEVLQDFIFADTLTMVEDEILNTNLLKDFDDVSALVDQALNQRLDYRSAKLNLQSDMDGIRIAESGHWPSLNAYGNYSLSTDNLSTIDQFKSLGFGLSLNFPLFLGWSVTNRVQIAEVRAKVSEIELSELERDIKRQIQINYLNLQAAQKGLIVSENNIKAARENLKIEEEKYSLGSGKLLDVLIANSRYTEAQSGLLNVQFGYIVLSQQLRYYLGVLDYKPYEQ